jgi:hypothetical protein
MTSRRKIVIDVLPSKDQLWFFHVRWTNGKIAMVSETYTRFQSAFGLACKLYEMFKLSAVLKVPASKQALLQRYVERTRA